MKELRGKTHHPDHRYQPKTGKSELPNPQQHKPSQGQLGFNFPEDAPEQATQQKKKGAAR